MRPQKGDGCTARGIRCVMQSPMYVAGRHDRMFPLDMQRRIARERLAIDVDEIDSGHMVAMSHPAELADRLEGLSPRDAR